MIRLILILIVVLPTLSFAQIDTVAHYYTYGSINHDLVNDITKTTDGGYVAVGSTSSSGDGNTDVYLLKVDSLCNYQWSYALGDVGNEIGNAVCTTYDDGIVIAASTNSYGGSYQACLMKRDAFGNFVWKKTFGAEDWDFVNDVVQTYDNGLVFCGETYNNTNGSSDVWIVKTNSQGDTLWTRSIGGIMEDKGNSIIETSDSNIVVAGMKTTYGDSTQAYVIKLDKVGNLLWDSLYGGQKFESIYDVIESSNGSYALVGASSSMNVSDYLDHYFLNISKNGALIVENSFSSTNNDETYSIRERPDGKFLASGYTTTFGAGMKDVHVYLITPAGGWGGMGITFGHYEDDEVFSSFLNTSGRMVFAGSTTSYGQGNTDAYLVRLDTIYNTNYNDKFDVLSIEDIAPISDESMYMSPSPLFTVYPNPTSGKLNIEFNKNEIFKESHLELVSLAGRLIESFDINNNYKVIDLSDLPAQIYFYRIKSKNEILETGKLIIY